MTQVLEGKCSSFLLIIQVFINFAKLQTDLADDELDDLPDDLVLLGKA